ncbi:hypothetical protein RZR10_09280 [Enterobacter asburiae]|uniref:hypothetical protein n=1 Tax=Enterobacteriaceae TaxID=543 RepID=UPI0010CB8DDA|nr:MULTISPECIES: hypothetical protein [Enterobacteriaceae]EMC3649830.1 hypothetical protein [Citrobacter braakii]EJB3705705.1 hypothetical protein [Escherichia coli]ELN9569535.1 hypothetical protein [Enterobacter roggenkampii]ELT0931628.1 hypothetical protein [Enterobacter roggenkampii]EMD2715013.1 hypothetical protein [Enterobacter roggenkampii]
MGNNNVQRANIKYDGETLTVSPLTLKAAEYLVKEISPYDRKPIIAIDNQGTGSVASVTVGVRYDSPWMNFVMPKFIAMTVVSNEDHGYA